MKSIIVVFALFIVLAGCDAVEEELFDLREIQFQTRQLAKEAPPDPEKGFVMERANIEYQLASSGPQYLQDSINHHIRRLILCDRTYCDEDITYERLVNGIGVIPRERERIFYFYAQSDVFEQREDIISFKTYVSVYAGGPSGNGSGSWHYTHLDRNGSQIEISQIVSDEDELFKIGRENFLPISAGVYPDLFFVPPDWYIKKYPNGSSVLFFQYQPYDVAPGVRGPVLYGISKEKIKHIVIEEFWP